MFESINKTSIRRILFLRPGAVGDLLVATAALREVCEQFPQAEICVAGPQTWTQILWPDLWPQVTEIFVLDKNAARGKKFLPNKHLKNNLDFSFPQSVWKTLGESALGNGASVTIQDEFANFDMIFNMRIESLRYAWRTLKIPNRFGTAPWPFKFLYTHWSPWLSRDPIIHERDRMFEILEAPPTSLFPIGFSSKNKQRLRFKQTGEKQKKPDVNVALQPGSQRDSLMFKWRDKALPQLFPAPSSSSKNKIFINPTASRYEKAWPKEKFRAYAQTLARELPQFEIALIGAPNETEWLSFVANDKLPIVQPKSFWELMAQLYQARALVTNTSSMQFFANSCGTPVCTLMGRTFAARWGPLGRNDLTICGRMPQSKVQDIFQEDFLAYDSMSVNEVLQKSLHWLQKLP